MGTNAHSGEVPLSKYVCLPSKKGSTVNGKNMLQLTHLCLASHKWDIGKQYRPRSEPQNAASDQVLQFLHKIQEYLKKIW